MTLMLDTHVLPGWAADDPRLGGHARRAIGDDEVLVSAVAQARVQGARLDQAIAAHDVRRVDPTR